MKQCTKCKKRKSIENFQKRDKYFHSWCKDCQTKSARKCYNKNKKKYNKTRYKRNLNNPAYQLLSRAKSRAKEKNWKFSLSIDDIIIPPVCPILNIPIERKPGKHNGSPSLDRINSNFGYTPNNIQVISDRANRLKSNGTLQEFEMIVDHLKKMRVT